MRNSKQYSPYSESSQTESVFSQEEKEQDIRAQVESVIAFCKEDHGQTGFFILEQNLATRIYHLACLCLQLLLACAHQRLDCKQWLLEGKYTLKEKPIARTIKSLFGEVRYWRSYLVRKNGKGGFYPLDAILGLTADGFTPQVISLCTKLATRMSFAAGKVIFAGFCRWAPSTEAAECLVLGLGREASAFMEEYQPPQGEGEVLIIEIDGKATPTATRQEMKQRKGKRKKHKRGCGCQRHRGKAKRKARTKQRKGKKKRRKRGDKSKNGRSVTLVVMYTLKYGKAGQLCGPINKKVWGSYAPRKVTIAWIRRNATKRGFPPGTNKRIHITTDGEVCLRKGLSELFPQASFALDIHHLEERLWDTGRAYHPEGSEELQAWVEEKRELLYTGRTPELLEQLLDLKKKLSTRARRDEAKLKALNKLIKYMQPRLKMMQYKKYLDEDLPVASGIIEGAVRYVIGERMDCSGMRWIPERAEALLHLRCIEINGDWDDFILWDYARRKEKLLRAEKATIRTTDTIDISDPNYMTPQELNRAA